MKRIIQSLQSLAPEAVLSLYELDATMLGEAEVLYFHNGTNGVNENIVWQGNTYSPLPIIVTGFEFTGEGSPPRPSLNIANVGGWLSIMVHEYSDLVGAKLTRRRTLARYLDGHESAGNVELPPDVFFINRKVQQTENAIEFELTSSLDLDGVEFPRRLVITTCAWRYYRGEGCGYAPVMFLSEEDGSLVTEVKDYAGRWNSQTSYRSGSSVFYASSTDGLYLANADTVAGETPGVSAKWDLKQRRRGEWSAVVADYENGDLVTFPFGPVQATAIARPYGSVVPTGEKPLGSKQWRIDQCDRSMTACKTRFDPQRNGKSLPFGGFPGTVNLPEGY